MKETEEEGEIETDRCKDRQIYKQRVVERETGKDGCFREGHRQRRKQGKR